VRALVTGGNGFVGRHLCRELRDRGHVTIAAGRANDGTVDLDLDLGDPRLDWVALASGMGLPAVRCASAEGFDATFAAAMAQRGPTLIEVALG